MHTLHDHDGVLVYTSNGQPPDVTGGVSCVAQQILGQHRGAAGDLTTQTVGSGDNSLVSCPQQELFKLVSSLLQGKSPSLWWSIPLELSQISVLIAKSPDVAQSLLRYI